MLNQFEARYPRGLAAKTLHAEQTQGAAESVESILNFVAPQKKLMAIATYRNPAGVMIDIWYDAEETPSPIYPPDAAGRDGEVSGPWKFASKVDGSRIDPLERETLARLEWLTTHAPKDKAREALVKLGWRAP
jgi:hypothetical protein